jgi:diaminopimelate decarboxylase
MKQLTDSEIERLYRRALETGQIADEDTAVCFYSRDILLDRLGHLRAAFPEDTLHAVAIKANSSPEVLKIMAEEGFGMEAASFEEVELAVAAGCPPSRIVFDSPVKTRAEITACNEMHAGITVNANLLQELERYPASFTGRLGLRINPRVASDAPDLWNVSGKDSKFGEDYAGFDHIVHELTNRPCLSVIHVHVGSGIRNFKANVEAVERAMHLADVLNERWKDQGNCIDTIDIGGGILFADLDGEYGLRTYASSLEATGLFDRFKVITEFGKFVHNDAGFVVSDIEYIKSPFGADGPDTAFIHVGADLFVRKVYSDLPLEFPCSVIRRNGGKPTGTRRYNIAGPLCFAGDYLYYDIELPELSTEDKFVIQRAGANTLSMWSRHCSRKEPKLIVV